LTAACTARREASSSTPPAGDALDEQVGHLHALVVRQAAQSMVHHLQRALGVAHGDRATRQVGKVGRLYQSRMLAELHDGRQR
jgi:hypothetical protein